MSYSYSFNAFVQVHFQYNQIFLLPIAIASVLLAYWLYRGFSKRYETSQWLSSFLGLLRTTVICVIAALVLVPFVRLLQGYTEKPVLAVGFDNSQSLALVDSATLRNLEGAVNGMLENLEDKYDVETYLFGETVAPGDWDLSDKRTNISDWLGFLSKNYRHGNLGGSVVISDGIFNLGGNPAYSLKQMTAPVFSVALGDTTAAVDLRVSFVNNNNIAYKGNQFPIKIGVISEKMKGMEYKVNLVHQGKVIASEAVLSRSDDFFSEHTFIVDAETVGIQKYSISLTEMKGELSTGNNYQQTYVEVIDADKSILIAYDAPHPDIAALRKSIERNRNYKVDLWWASKKANNYKVPDFDQYHLVMLHNLPSGRGIDWEDELTESQVSTLYFFDNTVQWETLSRQLQGISITPKSNAANEAYGLVNNEFVGFTLNKAQLEGLSLFPPLRAAFANVTFGSEHDVLLRQKIGNVATNYPMFAVAQEGTRKTGIFTAIGIWRWFVYDFVENGSHEVVDELMNQSIQYLSTKEDKRRLRLARNKFLFNENEDAVLLASFYDKNYQPALSGVLKATLKDEEGTEYEFGFLQKGELFEMNAGQMEPGEYTYQIKAALGDDLHYLSGSFTVAQVNVEFMQPKANHQVLFGIASQYGGKMYLVDQLAQLEQDLLNNDKAFSLRHEKAEITELIHNKWLFFFILTLLSIEWIIRKYKGAN